jgi:peptide deformylase
MEEHIGIVKRKNKIIVNCYDLENNKEIKVCADKMLSIVLQHEIDHLNGILFYDRINKNNPFYTENN